MLDILTRAGSFVFIIFLGYSLKRIGFFRQEDFTLLSRITIRITLPAAVIVNFAENSFDPALLSLTLLGLGGGTVYMLIGYLSNLRTDRERRAFDILNLPGYSIGTFVLPFAQNFLGPAGVIAISLFDTGNSVICLGGAYGVASVVKDGNGFSVKRILKALLTSVPFVTYIIMTAMNLTRIPVPDFVLSCARILADANAFMAMLMIGVGFKLDGDRSQIGRICRMLGIRYGVAAVLAAVYYYLLPLDLEVRQALVILAFAPIGSAVPGFTGELKGDVGLSCSLNSLSIIISMMIIVALLTVML